VYSFVFIPLNLYYAFLL
jgi:hypothetical protein